MAISRMQQPRQMYGLGSFVKKAVGKVTKPFTKVAKKLVPKEIAGIMRVAAPFLPPGYREAAYLLGTAKQTGRISPIDLALVSAPYLNQKFGKTDAGFFAETFPKSNQFLFGAPSAEIAGAQNVRGAIGETITRPATEGILGSGGNIFQFGKDKGSILDNARAFRDQTKAGQFLLGGEEGKFSPAKLAGVGVSTLSLIQNANTPREAGIALAQSTGDSDDLARGEELFSLLRPGIFDVPEAYRLPVAAANGGLMRTNYAIGSDDEPLKPDPTKPINPFQPEPIGPVLPDRKMAEFDLKDYMEEFESVFPEMIEKRGTQEYMDMLEDYFRGLASKDREGIMMAGSLGDESDDISKEMFGKPVKNLNPDELQELMDELERLRNKFRAANGGLMRTNYGNGTKKFNDKYLAPEYEDDFKKFLQELREQNKEMEMDTIMEMFKQKMRKQDPIREAKDGGLMRTDYAIGSDDKPLRSVGPKPTEPVSPDMKMAGMDRKDRAMALAEMLAEEEFGQDFYDLDIRTQMKVYQIALDEIDSGGNAIGGKPNNRMDLALGTKPTPQESGLGGLPIEADMRYTGGFMPYGAKEKADDVPARLSKNEFVFTADAVRAAGGGSVNEGAKKMYTAMKQLEKKPEAKGMMA